MALKSKKKQQEESTVIRQEVAKFAQLSAQWWDKEGSLQTLHAINPARLAFIEAHTTLLNQKVLDVGCGGGILSEAMAAAGALVKGIDAEAQAIACAQAHAKASQLKVTYECLPIENHPQETFDSVTCMELLEHVSDPGLLIGHCARLLRPSGLLFVSTINRTPKAYALAILAAEYVLNLLPRQTHTYAQFIKPSELAAMARKAGLELQAMSGLHYNPLTKMASLCDSVQVNYLMVFKAPP